MNKDKEEIGENADYLFPEIDNLDFEAELSEAFKELEANYSDDQELVEKAVSTESVSEAKRRGLVPQSGDWGKPKRWVRPEDADVPVDTGEKPRKKASLDEGASANVRRKNQKTYRAIEFVFGDDFDISNLQDMYSIGLDDFSTDITQLVGSSKLSHYKNIIDSRVEIQVAIHDDKVFDDRPVAGFMERSFSKHVDDGKLKVYHSRFMVYETFRNQGIASDISENVEKHYEKLGVHSISLTANATVGGYAWAIQGYDFILDRDRREIKTKFKETIISLHKHGRFKESLDSLLEELDSFEHPWEFASWNPSGFERKEYEGFSAFGKGVMLGTSWQAEKILDKKSPGYKIGKAYFAAKRNEKNIS